MQIEEVKRGQVVRYKTNGVYTYGLILGLKDKEFQKMEDIENKNLRYIKAGVYFLCKYSAINDKDINDIFLELLSALIRKTLDNEFNVMGVNEVSIASICKTEIAVKEEDILFWMTKSSMTNKAVNAIALEMKDAKEVIANYNALKLEREKYIDKEQKKDYLLRIKDAISKYKNMPARDFIVGNIYLKKIRDNITFVIPLENDKYLVFRPSKTNPWTILVLDKKLDYYESRCYIRNRYFESYQNGDICIFDSFDSKYNLYDLGISLFDFPYNVRKVKEIIEKYGG